ncbi:Expansin-A8 [Canna indica]|uniref:Expansin n=1 Tax=Canna indica TaxID=4628 RepID=A0AAQ3QIM2_9LILI|nr:Expansin-A8 [Canna indica]
MNAGGACGVRTDTCTASRTQRSSTTAQAAALASKSCATGASRGGARRGRPSHRHRLTATNYNLPGNNGGWCNPPRQHFDMSQPAWETIAAYRGGIVPVLYRR